jgi:hypothetical protein
MSDLFWLTVSVVSFHGQLPNYFSASGEAERHVSTKLFASWQLGIRET